MSLLGNNSFVVGGGIDDSMLRNPEAMTQRDLDERLAIIEAEFQKNKESGKVFINNDTLKYFIIVAKACAYADYPYSEFVSMMEKKLRERGG